VSLLILIQWLETYKIVTLNVNGMLARILMRMLADLLRKQEIDIILLQEVIRTDFDLIRENNAYTHVGITNVARLYSQGRLYN
jgi:exonuclease III